MIEDIDLIQHFRIFSGALSGIMPVKPSELKRHIHRFKVSQKNVFNIIQKLMHLD